MLQRHILHVIVTSMFTFSFQFDTMISKYSHLTNLGISMKIIEIYFWNNNQSPSTFEE